jgi:hypothetical protein
MPADIAPSPITAIDVAVAALETRATAMPRPAEIEVEEWAGAERIVFALRTTVKPESPPSCRSVRMRSRRPVRILCG